MNVLTMRQIDLKFGEVVALDGIDLDVEAGEMVALTGRSGSGKSSLINIAAGLLAPSMGGVSLRGEALVGRSATELSAIRRNHVGFVFQNLQLLPRITVGDNVMLPLEFADADPANRKERVLEVLNNVGLADRFDAFPAELSGGEQQRVAVARALVTKPSLLLADEPTSALDSVTAETVMSLIREACDQSGAAALVVTHQPAQAAWAQRVVHLRNGRIVGSSSSNVSPTEPVTANGTDGE